MDVTFQTHILEHGIHVDQGIDGFRQPSLATVPSSFLFGISTPDSKTGLHYEAFRSKYGQQDTGVLIQKAA